MTNDEKPKGIYRMTADIPIDLWSDILDRAKAEGVKPTQLVRLWLAERLLADKQQELEKRARKTT